MTTPSDLLDALRPLVIASLALEEATLETVSQLVTAQRNAVLALPDFARAWARKRDIVTIATTAGPVTMRAIRRGEWAAHQALSSRPGAWAITHGPSGALMGLASGRLAMAHQLRALAALPPCPADGWGREGDGITATERTPAYLDWIEAVRRVVA